MIVKVGGVSTSLKRVISKRVISYGVVGAAATLIHALVALALLELLALPAQWANLAGWVVALVASYTGQACYTFSDLSEPSLKTFARFVGASGALFVANVVALEGLLRSAVLPPAISVALAIGLQATLGYIVQRRWVFRRSDARINPTPRHDERFGTPPARPTRSRGSTK